MKLKDALKKTDNNYPKIHWDQILSSPINLTASFVIPARNSSKTLIETLKSIENQEAKDQIKEVIIVDDASTDDTNKLIKKYCQTTSLKIIFIGNQERRWTAFSRNRGLQLATGEVICFIDSDIVIPPNYLNYHLSLHQYLPKTISFSLRSFINKSKLLNMKKPFPIEKVTNEFRFSKIVPPEWCNLVENKKWTNKKIRIISDTDDLRNLGNLKKRYWSLPDVCLGCAICYNRSDLLRVKGAPNNFIGRGYNDISVAAKVISLGRFVIPILHVSVYHLNHPPRSGKNKDHELMINRKRYHRMLEMEQTDTFKYFLPEIENGINQS